MASKSFFLVKQKGEPDIGYTTGTCACAAAMAAARKCLNKESEISYVLIETPRGLKIFVEISDALTGDDYVCCSVIKNAGADSDVTDGIKIFSTVHLNKTGKINIDGGFGVGRVTKPGLDQPVGSAAINSVPRKMIEDNVRRIIGNDLGADVKISVPDGRIVAKRTFNSKLGIIGGISILGTSGIVEPMSEKALLDTILVEIKQKKALGYKILLAVPGNYGSDFLKEMYGININTAVSVSNFIFDFLQMACENNFSRIFFAGHIGKLIKVAGGVRNTHSKFGDRRMEIICQIVREVFCTTERLCLDIEMICKEISECISTDDAITVLKKYKIDSDFFSEMVLRIQKNMVLWTDNKIQIEVVVFSKVHGILGTTENAASFIDELKIMEMNDGGKYGKE